MAADFVRPMMIRQPPALGSKAPVDIAGILKEAGPDRRHVPARRPAARPHLHDVGRRLLDSLFENDYLKGSIASTGVVGVWAGPYTPGTAYNLLHHALGELDGNVGSWGQVIGGMGAISEAIASSARAAGAEIQTDAEVASIDSIAAARVTGVTLADGTGPPGADRRLRRAPEDHDHRPRRRRELPRRGRRGHGRLPDPRRLGEDQHGALASRPSTRA